MTTWAICRSQRKQSTPGETDKENESKKDCKSWSRYTISGQCMQAICSLGIIIGCGYTCCRYICNRLQVCNIHVLHTVSAFTMSLLGKSQVMWSYSGVSFENTPFKVVRKDTRECQFGPHYFKKRDRTPSRIYLQGTRKLGRHAHIDISELRLYPEYALSTAEVKLKSKQLQQLWETKL